jgi:hypothetical protein
MTKEHISLLQHKYFSGKNGKFVQDENTRIRNSLKRTWKTERRISHNVRIVCTPAGRFLVTEDNGRTTQLTRIDHL